MAGPATACIAVRQPLGRLQRQHAAVPVIPAIVVVAAQLRGSRRGRGHVPIAVRPQQLHVVVVVGVPRVAAAAASTTAAVPVVPTIAVAVAGGDGLCSRECVGLHCGVCCSCKLLQLDLRGVVFGGHCSGGELFPAVLDFFGLGLEEEACGEGDEVAELVVADERGAGVEGAAAEGALCPAGLHGAEAVHTAVMACGVGGWVGGDWICGNWVAGD